MQQRGDLGPDTDPGPLAYSLLAATQGRCLLTQTHRDAYALEAALGAAIDRDFCFIAAARLMPTPRWSAAIGPDTHIRTNHGRTH
jgi:hypothetical protein